MAEAGTITVADLHRKVRDRFRAAGLPSPDLDARMLVLDTLGIDLTELVARPDRVADAAGADLVELRMARRLSGEPVHRILGRRSFYGLTLSLSPGTLEPRPDTEILVDALAPHVERTIAAAGRCRILDLGTGTGAVALALLSRFPQASAVGTDIAPDALETARRNAQDLGLDGRIELALGNWFEPVSGCFDVIASNPPYIRSNAIPDLSVEVRAHDPLSALDGGPDGLDAYRAIAGGAERILAAGGTVGVEIGYDQKAAVTALFEARSFSLLTAARDFGGNDRVLLFALEGDGNAAAADFPGA